MDQAAAGAVESIQVSMNTVSARSRCRLPARSVPRLLLVAALCLVPRQAFAQEAPQAPLAPPPEHDVRRMSNVPEAPAPPALPPEEIIKKFSQKEDQYLMARAGYGFRKTIRIDEFDREGKLVGQYLSVSEQIRAANGRLVNKVVQHPQSSLHLVPLEPEDVKELDRIPPFPLNTGQLAKYDLKFVGDEQIDEIPCYIFQVKPKGVDRTNAYFEGVVWVDSKYLEVVKTYGKWVNELGDVKIANMPFTTFETYRENVDGKYWFPNYQRSDETVHLKDGDFPVRLVIKWSEFKPLLAAGVAAPASAATSAPLPSQPPAAPTKPADPAKPPQR
jgi:hypothetical protein